jgi:hypothetical protein
MEVVSQARLDRLVDYKNESQTRAEVVGYFTLLVYIGILSFSVYVDLFV